MNHQALLAAIVESSDDGILTKSLDGTVLSWNRAAERIFGYSADQIVGKSINLLIPPDRIGEERHIIAQIKLGRRVDHFETIRRTRDGKLIDVSVTVSPVRDPDGNIIGASKICRDITIHKQFEKERMFLAAIIDSSDDAILTKSLDGAILSWNAAAQRIFGYSPAEVIGKPVELIVPPDRIDEERTIHANLKKGHRIDHFETVRIGRDRRLVDVSITISPIWNSAGEPTGASMIFRDLTQQKRDQALLSRSDAIFKGLLDALTEGVVFLDLEGSVKWANEGVTQILGRPFPGPADPKLDPRTQIIRPDGSLFPVEDQPGMVALRTGQSVRDVEMGLPQVEGTGVKWVSVNAEQVRNPLGETLGVVVSFFDITERKQTQEILLQMNLYLEEKIRERTRELTEAQRLGRMGNWSWDRKTGKLTWSQELFRIFGFDPVAPLPSLEERFQLYTESSRKLLESAWAAAVETGKPFELSLERNCPNKRNRSVLVNGEAIRDAQGQIARLRGTVQDVTQIRENEEALKRSLDRLNLATRATNVGIWDFDRVGNTLTWDEAMFRLYGVSRNEFRGVYEDWSGRLHPEDRAFAEEELQKAVRGEKEFNIEFRVIWPDGTVRTIKGMSTTQRDAEGRVAGLIGVNFDITDLKRVQDELKAANTQAQLTNSELQAFSYSVSHDLRAPLRGIDGWSQALVEDFADILGDRGREYLQRVRSEAQRMGQLIDDMLKLSRTSQVTLHPTSVDLSEMVRRIEGRLRKSDPERQVEVTVDPDMIAYGDKGLLEVAMTNLVENAWKFTCKRSLGKIAFTRRIEGGEAIYSISDNGAGFDMAYATKLFGPFQRFHKMSEFPGTGIGLATVFRVIQRHGGRIWAHSQVDEGAAFHFTLEKKI